MASVVYEVCVESAADARAAEEGGAARVELCAGLLEGGTTPSVGAMHAARAAVAIPIVALIRPRPGDFVHDDEELLVLERDVDAAKEARLDGVAFGLLDRRGELDLPRLRRLLSRARPLEVTFHRAFDQARDARATLAQLAELGVERVLSSGGAADALAGAERLRELVALAGERIRIVAAGGVRPENVAQIVRASAVGEVHGSASPFDGPLGFTGSRRTDPARVRALVRALAEL
jgi:copper homeostasis protein